MSARRSSALVPSDSNTQLVGSRPLTDPILIRENRSAARAPETRRAFAKNWALFVRWCAEGGAHPLPASAETVEAFIVYLADLHVVRRPGGKAARRGMKPSAVAQALWAINVRHRGAGLAAPGDAEQVRLALAGIRRRKGTRRRQQAPLTIEHLRGMRFRDDLKGKRDKALLLTGFAGCLRRSELVAIDAEHLEETADGLRLLIPRSKTDAEGGGVWVDLLRAQRWPELCPVRALREWLAAAGIAAGPVFRSVRPKGSAHASAAEGAAPPLGGRLSAGSVDAIVKWAAGQCGFDRSRFGGHSLRAGKATYLADQGKPATLIAKHGRWKSLNMVLQYDRGDVARHLIGSY